MNRIYTSLGMIVSGLVVATSGVVAPAMANAVNTTAGTTINATVSSVISMTTSGTVALAITPTGSGSASSASDTVSVSTNNTAGYNLQLADSDATNTLANGGNTIAAASGTFAAPAAMAVNTWGYRVDGAGTFGAGPTAAQTNVASLAGTWAGVPVSGSPHTIKSTSSVATNDTTTVWYGARVDTSKPNGIYTGTITYTATTK